LTDDPMCLRQTPDVPMLSFPTTDDGDSASARGIAQGTAGHNTAQQAAAHDLQLLGVGQARKIAEATEDQARNDCDALAKAQEQLDRLILEHAAPEQIGEAEDCVDILQGKAELTALHNVNVQRELKAQRLDIKQQAQAERTRAEQDVRNSPSPLTRATLDAATARLRQALVAFSVSRIHAGFAEDLLDLVAGISVPFRPDAAAAIQKYPALLVAESAYARAARWFNSRERKDDSGNVVEKRLEQLQGAALELRNAWAQARDDARKSSDTELQKSCEWGFAVAERKLKGVTDTAFAEVSP
jgi:hypothetical protein